MWTFLVFQLLWNQAAVDPLGEMVARNFVDHLANRDLGRTTALLSAKVNFDGRIVQGEEAKAAFLKRTFDAHPARIRFLRVTVMTGPQALARFGRPPARLGQLNLDRALVVLARRKVGGLILVLEEEDRIPGRWRVVALSD
jgi:hypothetical protein